MVQPTIHIRPALVLALAFLFSACGLAYQQILVYALFDVSGNFVLAQSTGLGAFLLGMGLGTWRSGKATFGRLVAVEIYLALLGFLSVFVIYAGEVLLRYFYPWLPQDRLFFFFLPYVCAVGFFSGREVPLLMTLASHVPASRILGATYAGGLLALVTVPVVLVPLLDLPKAAFLTGVLNFSLACCLLWNFVPARWPQFAVLGLAVLLFPWLKYEPRWRDLHLKFIYFPAVYEEWETADQAWIEFDQMDPPVRIRSRYQWIDVLPSASSAAGGSENSFSLYLDRKFQVNALTERRYHETLAEAGTHLLARVPERVLILGGGDGLLAHYLLKNPGVKSVVLVELDPAVLQIARENRELKRLNGGVLNSSDGRVEVIAGDGFNYLRRSRQKFDLIYTDFPLPTTYELSLLYTREFYTFARARLAADGLLLMDFATPDSKLEGLGVLASSLKSAGFTSPLAFGFEDLFLAMAADGRPLKFDYSKIASNGVLVSTNSRQKFFDEAAARGERANSLFFPHRFDFDYRGESRSRDYDPALRPVLFDRYTQFHVREFMTKKPDLRGLPDADTTWEHRFSGERNSSVLHMYNCGDAASLRAYWKSKARVPDGEWCGISYDFSTGNIVTHTKTDSGFSSSDGTKTVVTPQGWETRAGDEVLYTRYFSDRQLNPSPRSREDLLIQKVFGEFMMMPSSFTMSSKLKFRGFYYP